MSAVRQRLLNMANLEKTASHKEASVAQYAALADSLESGELGDDAKYAFEGVMDSVGDHITDDSLVKSASYPENHYNIYDENAARIARLETLLRK